MSRFLERLRNEPLVVVGIIAAALLAAIQSLAGHGVIGQDALDTVTKALDPEHGWALPIIVTVIGRFFAYGPKSVDAIRAGHEAEIAAILTPDGGAVASVADEPLPGVPS